ncbi:MAG: flavodoxin [Clostridiales Family XIII bacterium]|jgi:flavodoxin|nr:flavodoxin [Clostridiales Family XIII bacterium]
MNAVIYASKGGNTKKIADAIASALGVSACSVKEVGTIDKPIDLLFVGASIYAGGIDGKLKKFLTGLTSDTVKRVVVFGTAYTDKSAREQIATLLEPAGIEIADGFFQCKGSFLVMNQGLPNAEDLKDAAEFARQAAG